MGASSQACRRFSQLTDAFHVEVHIIHNILPDHLTLLSTQDLLFLFSFNSPSIPALRLIQWESLVARRSAGLLPEATRRQRGTTWALTDSLSPSKLTATRAATIRPPNAYYYITLVIGHALHPQRKEVAAIPRTFTQLGLKPSTAVFAHSKSHKGHPRTPDTRLLEPRYTVIIFPALISQQITQSIHPFRKFRVKSGFSTSASIPYNAPDEPLYPGHNRTLKKHQTLSRPRYTIP